MTGTGLSNWFDLFCESYNLAARSSKRAAIDNFPRGAQFAGWGVIKRFAARETMIASR